MSGLSRLRPGELLSESQFPGHMKDMDRAMTKKAMRDIGTYRGRTDREAAEILDVAVDYLMDMGASYGLNFIGVGKRGVRGD